MSVAPNSRSFNLTLVSGLRRAAQRMSSLAHTEKDTLQTHQTTAEDDLFSITNEIMTPIPNAEMDPQQISAWNHYARTLPFRLHSPMKQITPDPILSSHRSSQSQRSEKSEKRSELKAKLRQYEASRNFNMTSGLADEPTLYLTSDDHWEEVEKLNLDQLDSHPATRQRKQPSLRKKTMILRPFYSMISKRCNNPEIKAKSVSNHQNRSTSRSSSSRRDASKFETISHTTELKFPALNQDAKLQMRLALYKKQIPLTN